ncbi:hypothetical protein PY793_08915 [Acetobacter fabarum]|uniref:hypothetical protein n=1 Tax=Acetobacter fabarum TaxID=483199 RepID=UPI00312BA548
MENIVPQDKGFAALIPKCGHDFIQSSRHPFQSVLESRHTIPKFKEIRTRLQFVYNRQAHDSFTLLFQVRRSTEHHFIRHFFFFLLAVFFKLNRILKIFNSHSCRLFVITTRYHSIIHYFYNRNIIFRAPTPCPLPIACALHKHIRTVHKAARDILGFDQIDTNPHILLAMDRP